MITTIYIGSDEANTDYSKFDNGVNVEIARVSNDETVELIIQDDGGKHIITFSITFEDLKKAVSKLDI